jgi:hypothetical protein
MGACCSKEGEELADPQSVITNSSASGVLDDAHGLGPRDHTRQVIRNPARSDRARLDRWQSQPSVRDDLDGETPSPTQTKNTPSPTKQRVLNTSDLNIKEPRRESTPLVTHRSRTSSATSTLRVLTPPATQSGLMPSGSSLLSGVSPTVPGGVKHDGTLLGDGTGTFSNHTFEKTSERGNDSFTHATTTSGTQHFHFALATMITSPTAAVPTKLPPVAPHSRRVSEDGAPTRPPPITIGNSNIAALSSGAPAVVADPSTDGFEMIEDLEGSSTPCVGGGSGVHQQNTSYRMGSGEKPPTALHSPTDMHRHASTRSMRSLNFSATFMMSSSEVHQGHNGGMPLASASGKFAGGGGSSSEFAGDVVHLPPVFSGALANGQGSSSQRSNPTPRPSPGSGLQDIHSHQGGRCSSRSPSAAAEVSMTFELLPGSTSQFPLGAEGVMGSSDHLTNSRQSESAAFRAAASSTRSHRGPTGLRSSAAVIRPSGFTSVLTSDEHRRAVVAAQRQEASANMMSTPAMRFGVSHSASYGVLDDAFGSTSGGGGGSPSRRMERGRAASPLSVRAAPHRQFGVVGGSMSRQSSFPNLGASAVHLSVAASTQEFGDLVDEDDFSTSSSSDSS